MLNDTNIFILKKYSNGLFNHYIQQDSAHIMSHNEKNIWVTIKVVYCPNKTIKVGSKMMHYVCPTQRASGEKLREVNKIKVEVSQCVTDLLCGWL